MRLRKFVAAAFVAAVLAVSLATVKPAVIKPGCTCYLGCVIVICHQNMAPILVAK